MFAIVDSPGGQWFEYSGPGSKADVEAWALRRTKEIRDAWPGQSPGYAILTDKQAYSLKWSSGEKVIQRKER